MIEITPAWLWRSPSNIIALTHLNIYGFFFPESHRVLTPLKNTLQYYRNSHTFNKLVAIFSEQKKLYVYVHFCLNFKGSILWRW